VHTLLNKKQSEEDEDLMIRISIAVLHLELLEDADACVLAQKRLTIAQ
jgi:hypothetical protein